MDDLISRQAAIDVEGLDEEIRCEMCRNPMHTNRGCDGNCKYDEKLYERIIQILNKRIKQLPPAQPERKTGKWIDGKRMKNDGTFYWFRQCDQCGYERNDCDTENDSNFCPDCGADMRQIGEHDGER